MNTIYYIADDTDSVTFDAPILQLRNSFDEPFRNYIPDSEAGGDFECSDDDTNADVPGTPNLLHHSVINDMHLYQPIHDSEADSVWTDDESSSEDSNEGEHK